MSDKQTVYQHLKSHKNILRDHSVITWNILHNNIKQQDKWRCIEAFEIQNRFYQYYERLYQENNLYLIQYLIFNPCNI